MKKSEQLRKEIQQVNCDIGEACLAAPQPGIFGEPSLMRVQGRWSKKHQAEAEKIIERILKGE